MAPKGAKWLSKNKKRPIMRKLEILQNENHQLIWVNSKTKGGNGSKGYQKLKLKKSKNKKSYKQAAAELGKAQPKLGLS